MAEMNRFRAVLTPLDGSDMGEQAIPVSASIAGRSGAALHLVTVLEPFGPLMLPTEVPVPQVQEETRHRLMECLTRASGLARSKGAPVVKTALLEGPVAKSLARYVAAEGIDLVVMMTHGRGGLSRLWLGSVADRLLRTVSVPLLLMRPAGHPQPISHHRFLVALDGEIEQEVLEAALRFAELLPGATMILARVVESPIPGSTPQAVYPTHFGLECGERQELEARKYLARVKARLGPSVPVTTKVYVGGPVPDQILNLARAAEADLVVMGTHGARGLERLLLGSVADKVIRQSELPLLVAPILRGRSAPQAVAVRRGVTLASGPLRG
jgi:nucleotide-binding universal stress UspA family protein